MFSFFSVHRIHPDEGLGFSVHQATKVGTAGLRRIIDILDVRPGDSLQNRKMILIRTPGGKKEIFSVQKHITISSHE